MNLGAYPALAVQRSSAFAAGGRLTLVPNTPVIPTDQAAKAVIYYTPDQYGAFPVIKNGVIRPVYFTDDLKLTMTSAFTGSGIFDLFGIERGGRGVLVAGAGWATATAGAGARGTTPGQTEITRVAGMRVNRWGMPGLSAENATYIEPLEGRYLGSVLIDSSAGQTTCNIDYGQSRKCGLWNADQRRRITLKVGDPTATWAYGSGIRQTRSDTTNFASAFCGLAESSIECVFSQRAASMPANSIVKCYIGVDSVSTPSGVSLGSGNPTGAGSSIAAGSIAHHSIPTLLGLSKINMLESGNGAVNATMAGAEVNCLMTVSYQA